MISNLHRPLGALLLALASITFPSFSTVAAEIEDELYGTPKLLALKIEIPAPGLEALRKDAKTYAKGTVREGDKVFANVGIRLKGASGVQLLDRKPSLTLKFDEFESGQFFHGHEKIALNNALEDSSYLSEAIGGEIFRAAGVPAARVTFARVDLNGRDLGLYILSQPPNRDFLSDFFKKTKGNFYEGKSADVTETLHLDFGKSPKDQADLKALVNAAREPDLNQRLKKLATILDVERFLSFLAVEVFAWHRNGYVLARNNYRIYHDPVAARVVFIPGSLDELFSKVNAPLLPEAKGLVARAILESPEGRRLYRERMTKLLGTALKPETLHARINDLAAKIRPAAARDANETKAFDAALALLRDNVANRAKFLTEELKNPAQ